MSAAYSVTAHERGGALEGTFQGKDGAFAFTLKFSTDGTTYTLSRQGPINPLAKKPLGSAVAANPVASTNLTAEPRSAGATTNGPAGGPALGPAWRTYRHPTGLAMSYPPDWQLKEHPQMLQLIPPNAGEGLRSGAGCAG